MKTMREEVELLLIEAVRFHPKPMPRGYSDRDFIGYGFSNYHNDTIAILVGLLRNLPESGELSRDQIAWLNSAKSRLENTIQK